MKAMLVFLTILSLTLLAAGCGALSGLNDSEDPMTHPDFLTPVAVAQDAGVTVYWLGEEFQAGGLMFQITSGSQLINRTGNGPGLELTYAAHREQGSTGFDVESYSERSGEADELRKRALRVRGAMSKDVRVGPWQGELISVPAGTRPVNALGIFIDLGDTVVVGEAGSGTTGIPGEDSNPLIVADLLIEVMQQLRPYPE